MEEHTAIRTGMKNAAISLCRERGQSLRQALRADFARSYNSAYGSLKNGNPSFQYLCEICEALKIGVREFLERSYNVGMAMLEQENQ